MEVGETLQPARAIIKSKAAAIFLSFSENNARFDIRADVKQKGKIYPLPRLGAFSALP
jgi:hypothetical protein